MYELGCMNRLTVFRIDQAGAWLNTLREKVFLPQTELTDEIQVGDELEVFVYANKAGEAVATLQTPHAMVGEFALLRASQVNEHGAFLDWGLEKDLLVPHKEQPEPMKQGRSYLVKVRLDRQGRPLATARIEKCLSSAGDELEIGQAVDLVVWQFTPLGAKVIIDHRFGGLLYRDEIGHNLNYGDQLKGYVRKVRGDGKVDITLQMSSLDGLDEAKMRILDALRETGGSLPLHDGSSPEEIRFTLGMSKKLFKKAVGGLYKTRQIDLVDGGIKLKGQE